MMFTETYEPRIDDYGIDGKISQEAILKILENSGNHHTQKVLDKVTDNGIAWILTEWYVEFYRRPGISETMHIATWVHGKAPTSTVFRDFIVSDDDGKEIVRASARFALLNLQENKLTRITPELFCSYGPEEKIAFETNAPRLPEPKQYDIEQPIVLRRSDIDFNGHVHNTHDLDFALNALPEEIYARDHITSAHIVYRLPLKLTDRPVIRTVKAETGFISGIYADDKLCTLTELKVK